MAERDSLGAVADDFRTLALADEANGDILVDDPEYGRVRFGADGSVEAEGRRLEPAEWTIAGEARTFRD